MSDSLEDIIARTSQLASLPSIYHELQSAIDDPDSSIDDIAVIINRDPNTAAQILRLANSSLYNFGSEITSINRAVMQVGTRQLRDLVLATAVITQFSRMKIQGIDLKNFWAHSIACGITARNIAIWRREKNIEQFYVAALFHDLGLLMLFLQEPEAMQQILENHDQTGIAVHILEHQTLGFDHSMAGSGLLAHWNIPLSLTEPILFHHDPESAPNDYQLAAATLHIADLIVIATKMGISGQRMVPRLNESAWDLCELQESSLPEIITQTQNQHIDAIQVFLAA
ncbi:MAG: HDOD domain-containing protein [Gammaproteobacteria bacterium]|nr:HDOD domain-containing protein [Gammaproteobacteria bacterium]